MSLLLAHRPLLKMGEDDRVRALYRRACFRYVTCQHTTNTSVRELFGIAPKHNAQTSGLIRDALVVGVIAPLFGSEQGLGYSQHETRIVLPPTLTRKDCRGPLNVWGTKPRDVVERSFQPHLGDRVLGLCLGKLAPAG